MSLARATSPQSEAGLLRIVFALWLEAKAERPDLQFQAAPAARYRRPRPSLRRESDGRFWRFSRLLPVFAVGSLALSLGGCVSLLPKTTPAALYRFGAEESGPIPNPSIEARGVTLAPIDFPREAMTDGILTIEGSEASYLAGARWVAPAPVLFRHALDRAFEATAPGINLLGRGEVGKVAAILDLQVNRFEADYTDPKGAPTVRVTVQARLNGNISGPVAARTFDASVPASENGARAIVAAYNAAIGQTLGQLSRWVDENTPPAQPVRSTSTTTSTTSTSTTIKRQP